MTGFWSVDCAGVSHVGLVRSVNEDAWVARPETGLFAVADGMGGHQRGDVASRMVVDALARLPPAPDARTMRERVEVALMAVNESLRPEESEDVSGSTVAVLLMCGRHFAVLWAGDSRVYRAGSGGFVQLTRDHSLVQDLVDRGVLPPDAVRDHHLSSHITRAVGASPILLLDGTQGELKAGDVFLLCSDGLTRHVEDAEIQAVLEGLCPQVAIKHLLDTALARGATDNVTAVVLKISASDGGVEARSTE